MSGNSSMRVVVLRSEETSAYRNRGQPGPPTALTIEALDLDESDYLDLEADPAIRGFAEVLPTTLIAPVDSSHAPGGDGAWGIEAIGAKSSTWTGRGVRCAILDTGIDSSHPAFAGVSSTTRDFTGEGSHDSHGHGTHCAGTFFGREVEGTRIGIATGVATALVGKVLGSDGRGTTESLLAGIEWAAKNRAHVISMSVGINLARATQSFVDAGLDLAEASSRTMHAYWSNRMLFETVLAGIAAGRFSPEGSLIVAAAGNDSDRRTTPHKLLQKSTPADASSVVSVGAVGREPTGRLRTAYFSNEMPTIVAPGVDVTSAQPGGGLIALSGTSMACPHVAGIAALYWEKAMATGYPRAELIRANLISEAQPQAVHRPRWGDHGYGLVSAPVARR